MVLLFTISSWFWQNSDHCETFTFLLYENLSNFERSKLDTQYYQNWKETYRYVLALRASASPPVTTNTEKVWQRFWVPVGSTGTSHPLNVSKLGYNKQRLLLSRLWWAGMGVAVIHQQSQTSPDKMCHSVRTASTMLWRGCLIMTLPSLLFHTYRGKCFRVSHS